MESNNNDISRRLDLEQSGQSNSPEKVQTTLFQEKREIKNKLKQEILSKKTTA